MCLERFFGFAGNEEECFAAQAVGRGIAAGVFLAISGTWARTAAGPVVFLLVAHVVSRAQFETGRKARGSFLARCN
jgi:hypothetical protein